MCSWAQASAGRSQRGAGESLALAPERVVGRGHAVALAVGALVVRLVAGRSHLLQQQRQGRAVGQRSEC